MTDFDDDFTPAPEDEPAPITRPVHRAAPDRSPPHSAEAEEHVIACCLLDGNESIDRALQAGLKPDSFYFPANRLLFEIILESPRPVTLETLAEELKTRRQIEAVGGFAYLMQVTGKIPTTAHAGYFIEKVREKALLREAIRSATQTVEEAYSFTGGLDEFLDRARSRIDGLVPAPRLTFPLRQPSAFGIPAAKDPSILLGNRYLNRGDGMILSGPSGMGKSSIQLQAAACWALGRDFHGILPNGPQKSLIVQSEDSDGDIAEVWASLLHMLNPTPAERTLLDTNLRIVTDRVNRGSRFISALKAHLAAFTPDLVWLNPLQAFIDGDVTDSQDIGAFLREGLNGLNADSRFGYVIIHHTTKPATGKDRSERLWHEVMYDMAGGAELINWARAIISLRPTATEGEFKLVLAKRGRRAGVVRMVDAGVGQRAEPVTVIGLKHATGFLPGTSIPIIFWEPCAIETPAYPEDSKPGKKEKFRFSDFASVFPRHDSRGMALNELHRLMEANAPIKKNSMFNILKRWEDDGFIEVIREPGQPMRYRSAV